METLRQLKYIKDPILQFKWKLALMGFLTLVVSFVALAPPYFSKLIFDKGVRANDLERIFRRPESPMFGIYPGYLI